VTDRLYRSPTDRMIAGVAGGLATWLNLDPSLVRVAWVLLAILSGGVFVVVYIVTMIVVPLPPPGWVPQPRAAAGGRGWPAGAPWAGPGAPGGAPGWQAPGGAPGAVPGWQAPEGTPWGPAPGTTPGPGWNHPASRLEAGNAGIVFGVVLVLLGGWFLVDRYVHVDWGLLWPVAVILLGVVLIAGAMRRGRSSGG
jgi:phage shock protein C